MAKKNREDWIRDGLARLSERGVEGVRVEPLAKALGVTKGSFYWHFADRDELLTAMLADWVDWATESVIDHANQAGEKPIERLDALMRIVTRGFRSDLEFEIRAWARRDDRVARLLDQVDRRRTGYLRDLLQEEGFDPLDAEARAFMLYSMLIGDDLIAKGGRGRVPRRKVIDRATHLLTRGA